MPYKMTQREMYLVQAITISHYFPTVRYLANCGRLARRLGVI